MDPALPFGRRVSLRRDGKAAGDRIIVPVETGLAPSLAARHRPGRAKPASLRASFSYLWPSATSTSVPYTPWPGCVRIVATRTSTFMPGLTAHVQFRYWRKERGKRSSRDLAAVCAGAAGRAGAGGRRTDGAPLRSPGHYRLGAAGAPTLAPGGGSGTPAIGFGGGGGRCSRFGRLYLRDLSCVRPWARFSRARGGHRVRSG